MKHKYQTTRLQSLWNIIRLLILGKPTYPFHNGILIKVPVSECFIKQGYPVITIEGDIGLITSFYSNLYNKNIATWLDIKLLSGKFKHVNESNLSVLFMYLPLTNKYYPLAHACYRYILAKHIGNVYPFRITKRNNAMLSETFLQDNEYVAKLSKSRYSASFINRIEQLNYKIKK
jgi:hypothetical protein